MNSANVHVTGGGGFVGSHVVERLVKRDDRVRVLDNFATGDRANLATMAVVEACVRSAEEGRAYAPRELLADATPATSSSAANRAE